jgi:hypothetical protein
MSDPTGWKPVDGRPGVSVRLAPTRSGRLVVTGVCVEAPAVTADMLRQIPLAAIEREANAARADGPVLPALQRGDLSAEDFSRLVADHFKAWAKAVPNPAAVMAEHAGVKSPTMHTWIRDARLRGLLPPAKRGKAG